jgi:hypothetical protein
VALVQSWLGSVEGLAGFHLRNLSFAAGADSVIGSIFQENRDVEVLLGLLTISGLLEVSLERQGRAIGLRKGVCLLDSHKRFLGAGFSFPLINS